MDFDGGDAVASVCCKHCCRVLNCFVFSRETLKYVISLNMHEITKRRVTQVWSVFRHIFRWGWIPLIISFGEFVVKISLASIVLHSSVLGKWFGTTT